MKVSVTNTQRICKINVIGPDLYITKWTFILCTAVLQIMVTTGKTECPDHTILRSDELKQISRNKYILGSCCTMSHIYMPRNTVMKVYVQNQ
jgi:hypothetical protein